ncbi:hypothetical protein GETHED_09480 [Geothrix edaphica]|uniref:Exo-alpha-sialidase n=2 Tax=Geothrix edaphica TaxID=2927976 RepID=A0ABQ5PWT4_9BACT|nr:hypothetical protein GETHED_09480 [Geothrix edaphica]
MVLERLRRFAQGFGAFGDGTGCPEWRKPAVLDQGRLGEARVALDHEGRGVVLWENDGGLWALPLGPGASPELMRFPLGEGAAPRVALSPEGRGLAIWMTDLKNRRQILGKVLGTDENPEHVLFRTVGRIHQLQVAVDRRGNALVAWVHENMERIEVMAQSFDSRGEAWEKEPVVLGLPGDPSVSPHLAANHREYAMVLWEAQDGSFEGLMACHYWPSDRIWSDRPVPVVAHEAHHHQVAMDDSGNALALWIHTPHGQRSVLEAGYYDVCQGEWSEPVVLANAQAIVSPRLVMNGHGEAMATWCQREGAGACHLFAKDFKGRAWEPGAECLDHGHQPIQDYAIDLAADGRAGFLVVQQGAAGNHVSVRIRQAGWSAPRVVGSARDSVCASPRIALSPRGGALLWTQGADPKRSLVLVGSL